MPFDQTEPLLSPAVADLPPRERLERLRLWLLTEEAWESWTYDDWEARPNCGTAGCAGGWYEYKTGRQIRSMELGGLIPRAEFAISHKQGHAIFYMAHRIVGKTGRRNVTPADVAHVIGMAQRGEIT